jgi:hypothetical protein
VGLPALMQTAVRAICQSPGGGLSAARPLRCDCRPAQRTRAGKSAVSTASLSALPEDVTPRSGADSWSLVSRWNARACLPLHGVLLCAHTVPKIWKMAVVGIRGTRGLEMTRRRIKEHFWNLPGGEQNTSADERGANGTTQVGE